MSKIKWHKQARNQGVVMEGEGMRGIAPLEKVSF